MSHGNEPELAADPYDLRRFLTPQAGVYAQALAEIKRGRKVSHWVWYIFPQIDGLGFSSTTKHYSIKSVEEAEAYLRHPVLGPRLDECAEAVLQVQGKTAEEIFGETDERKLQSCATLFASVSPSGSPYHQIIDRYFQGQMDERTLEIIGEV